MSNGSVFAGHSFQLGVAGDYIPSKTLTHMRLDGLTFPPGGVLPTTMQSPNFVGGHS